MVVLGLNVLLVMSLTS